MTRWVIYPSRADNEAAPRTAGRSTRSSLQTVEYGLGQGRHGYLVPAAGAVEVNGMRIDARDGAAIKDVTVVRITAIEDSELVMVDAP